MSSLFKNFPKDIDELAKQGEPPFVYQGSEDEYRKKWWDKNRVVSVVFDPAAEPVIQNVPQEHVEPLQNGFRGVSIGIARALCRAGLFHMAYAYEFLADLGFQGKIVLRSNFMSNLSEFAGEKTLRTAYDEFGGKFRDDYKSKGAYKQATLKARRKFLELVPKIVPINILSTESTNSGTKSRRGRPCTSWIYIPTEREMEQLLLASGLVNSLDSAEFSVWPFKPFKAMASLHTYEDFLTGLSVNEGGTRKYSRKEIADEVGRHPNTVRKACERVGITVTSNPPIRKVILPEDDCRLPANEEERAYWVATGNGISDGTRIETKVQVVTDRGKAFFKYEKFDYTQGGARAARENSYNGNIYRTDYDMSTYDPTTSDFYEH